MKPYLVLVLLLTTLPAAAGPAPFETEIEARIEQMKEFKQRMKRVGDMVRGLEPFDPRAVHEAGTFIARESARIPSLYPPGSISPPSKATEEIWQKWHKFELLAQDLREKADRLAEGAEYANSKLSKRHFRALGRICAACHKHFRKTDDE